MTALTLVCALGCGLAAGVWFAFSAFVMDGLKRLPPGQGIAAMQAINRSAVTPLFMSALFGTAMVCVALAAWAGFTWDHVRAPWVLAGSLLYLIGTIGVTSAANVPLNTTLERLRPQASAATAQWTSYLRRWTTWNHVRGISSLAATALLVVALTVE
jgi:uncharacterized membrane protein